MININRGQEPTKLKKIRPSKLGVLRALNRAPVSNEINGYDVVADVIWKAQHYKCCYCEQKIKLSYNDVEHYRPKTSANRLPGCSFNHGYWWLAYTWSNLLFSCPSCNRSGKNIKFPLANGSISLKQECRPPGKESPLLIDPSSSINPVEHIIFLHESIGVVGNVKQWWARPRNQSSLGNSTIEVCKLNSADLLELRDDHYELQLAPVISNLLLYLNNKDAVNSKHAFRRAIALLNPKNPFVAFSYDAMSAIVPNNLIQNILGRGWPLPNEVGTTIVY